MCARAHRKPTSSPHMQRTLPLSPRAPLSPFLFCSNISKSPQDPRSPCSSTWDEEQGCCGGEDDPAGGVVHLAAAASQLLGLLPLLLLLRLLAFLCAEF